MVELDAAGQTMIIYKLKLGEMMTTITKIGRKVEPVEYKNLNFRHADGGRQDRIQSRRRQYYRRGEYTVWSTPLTAMTETELRRQAKNQSTC